MDNGEAAAVVGGASGPGRVVVVVSKKAMGAGANDGGGLPLGSSDRSFEDGAFAKTSGVDSVGRSRSQFTPRVTARARPPARPRTTRPETRRPTTTLLRRDQPDLEGPFSAMRSANSLASSSGLSRFRPLTLGACVLSPPQLPDTREATPHVSACQRSFRSNRRQEGRGRLASAPTDPLRNIQVPAPGASRRSSPHRPIAGHGCRHPNFQCAH